uniref:Uncharacterized protein n=1 Tax=Pseudictyota dubia TaxID=2749911 RepID=A0A7R9WK25_9STRA
MLSQVQPQTDDERRRAPGGLSAADSAFQCQWLNLNRAEPNLAQRSMASVLTCCEAVLCKMRADNNSQSLLSYWTLTSQSLCLRCDCSIAVNFWKQIGALRSSKSLY